MTAGWRPARFATPRDDDGTITMLVIGCVLVVGLMLAGVVDTARLYLARRALDAVTDAAALAGAQAADLDAVYSGRAGTDLPLDEAAVRRAVDRYLAAADVDDSVEGFVLDGVDVTATQVTVRAHAVVRLPFVGPIRGGRSTVVVRTDATARNHVLPA